MLRIGQTHSMEEYLSLLSDSLEVYMDADRLNKAFSAACYEADDLKSLALLWLQIESAGRYTSLNPDNIISYLLDIGVDLEKRYANRKTQNISLDMKKVIEPLIENGIAVELLSTYKEYRSINSYCNFMRKLVESQSIHQITPSGRTLVKFPTHVEEKDNLRTYYSDIAVVSVPKKYSNMITAGSDGRYIAWCDYPQADWRFAYNLFIRDESNYETMRQCEDAYEGLVRLIEGDKFDPKEFKEKRKEYKVHCLKVFYNSKDGSAIPSAIRDYFRSRPKYQRLLYDLNILYQFKLPIPCTSYFGYEQLIPEGAYPDAFISKALNTPIQTFTSHIVNETVFGILERFWSLGYTKDDINVYYVRHDEPLFTFTRNVLKDAWVFKECSEISIPGFTPIHLDFHFGQYYQEEDPMLTSEINQAIDARPEMISVFEPSCEKEYWPFPAVEQIYAQFFPHENGIRVELYDYRMMQRMSYISEYDESLRALFDALNNEGLSWLRNPQYLMVRSNGLEAIDYAGENEDVLVKVVDKPDSMIALGG